MPQQILFDQPYNRQLENEPKIYDWAQWRLAVYSLFNLEPTTTTSAANNNITNISTNSSSLSIHASTIFDNTLPTHTSKIPRKLPKRIEKVGRTSQDIQQQYNQMQLPNSEPLSPEDIASIVSGSVSLLDEDDLEGLDDLLEELDLCGEQDFDELKLYTDQYIGVKWTMSPRELNASTASVEKDETSVMKQTQKKKEIREALNVITKTHLTELLQAEKRQALQQSDDSDVEGLQVFRTSYKNWKKHSKASTLKK